MTPREQAAKTDDSAMPLIMSLDDSVRELKDDLHSSKRTVFGPIITVAIAAIQYME